MAARRVGITRSPPRAKSPRQVAKSRGMVIPAPRFFLRQIQKNKRSRACLALKNEGRDFLDGGDAWRHPHPATLPPLVPAFLQLELAAVDEALCVAGDVGLRNVQLRPVLLDDLEKAARREPRGPTQCCQDGGSNVLVARNLSHYLSLRIYAIYAYLKLIVAIYLPRCNSILV